LALITGRIKILGTAFTHPFGDDTLHVEQIVQFYKAQKCDTNEQELDFVPPSHTDRRAPGAVKAVLCDTRGSFTCHRTVHAQLECV